MRRDSYWWETVIEVAILPIVICGVVFLYPAMKVFMWIEIRRRRGE